MMDEQEYIQKYNSIENFANEMVVKFKSKEISYDDYINLIKSKVKELGLKTIKGGLMPPSPELLYHNEGVVLKEGVCPDSWTSPYYVPEGNWLYNKVNDCGKGCLCVDNGADRPSLDIINSLTNINVEQVCDGSKEHTHRPRTNSLLALKYKSKNPINLENLKLACRTSEKITVDDRTRPRIIDNLCTGEELTDESTKQIRRNSKQGMISFFGRGENISQFWRDSATVLSNIEDIGMGRQKPQKIKNTPKLQIQPQSMKRKSGFDFGGGFQL